MISIGIELKLFGVEFSETVAASFLIVLFLTIILMIMSYKIKRANPEEKSRGLVLIGQLIVESVEGLVVSSAGEKNKFLSPYIASLIIFLVFANLSGLLGITPPTSDYNVTLGLALITAVLIHANKIRNIKLSGYVKGYFEPVAFMLPLNLLEVVTVPLSMSFRLFGNILAGVIIMSIVYSSLAFFTPLIAPFFHGYFDIFAGLAQTIVFTLLTIIYVGGE